VFGAGSCFILLKFCQIFFTLLIKKKTGKYYLVEVPRNQADFLMKAAANCSFEGKKTKGVTDAKFGTKSGLFFGGSQNNESAERTFLWLRHG
jgi:hypothetical protein